MPPRRRAQPSQEQLRLRGLRRDNFQRRLNEAAVHLRTAAAFLATRGPQRSLRIAWLWDNPPACAAGHAPWYRLVLFGEDDYHLQGFPPDGYRIVVADNDDTSTDTDY